MPRAARDAPGPELGRHARRRGGAQLGRLPEVRRRAAGRRPHERDLRRATGIAPRAAARRRHSARGARGPDRRMAQDNAGTERAKNQSCSGCSRLARDAAGGLPRRHPQAFAKKSAEVLKGNQRAFAAGVLYAAEHPLREPRTIASAPEAPRGGEAAWPTATRCAPRRRSSPAAGSSGAIRSRPRPRSCSSSAREIWKYGGTRAPGRGRDRGHRRGRRRVVRGQEGDDRDVGPGHVAQDRDARPGHDRRAAARAASTCSAAGPRPACPPRASSRTCSGGVLRPRRRAAAGAGAHQRGGHVPDTVEAFNIAEQYQTPVILLSDQEIAQRKETRGPDRHRARSRSWSAAGRPQPSSQDYARFALTDVGREPDQPPGHDGRQLSGVRASSTTSAAPRPRAARSTRA